MHWLDGDELTHRDGLYMHGASSNSLKESQTVQMALRSFIARSQVMQGVWEVVVVVAVKSRD